jgi:hypothetical protein
MAKRINVNRISNLAAFDATNKSNKLAIGNLAVSLQFFFVPKVSNNQDSRE